MEQKKRKRGRPAPEYGIRIYPCCGRKIRLRDGVEVPCKCKGA